MKFRPTTFTFPWKIAALAAATAALAGHTAPAEEEEATSDYLDRIELRSIVSLPGELMFSLHDPETDNTFWIQTGETRNEIHAVAFDDEANQLTLRHGEAERQVGLTTRRSTPAPAEETAEAAETTEAEDREARREEWRERREERRQEWEDFRERWEAAAENSPEIREIQEHFGEIRGEIQELRAAMRDADRDSDEFRELRARGGELREELGLLRDYASETVSNHPDFSEEDAERIGRMFGRGAPRRGGPR